MSKAEAMKKVISATKRKKPTTEEVGDREKILRESRDQYRNFLESINRSSDRDIEQAMSRA